MKTTLLCALAIIMIGTSCSKENTTSSDNKLAKIIIHNPANPSSDISQKYTYNSQGLITEISSSNNTGGGARRFTYNASGLAAACSVTDDTVGVIINNQFIYDSNNKLIRVNASSPPNFSVQNVVYTYDANGRLASDTFYQSTGDVSSYRVYEFNSDGNLTARQQFIKSGSSYTTEGRVTFQHDNHPNPYYESGMLFYSSNGGAGGDVFCLSKNNITTLTVNGTLLYNYAYTYYDNGLPHTLKVDVTGALESEFFYE